jgi:acetylornithine deacetylase/succinyl-diaminopimelate desuccinylase-like protein
MTAVANRRITALAADRAVHRAFGWLHLHELQVRRWQMEFLAIAAPTFHESARALWFVERFRELGLQGAYMDDAGNALAELPGASDGPVVLMSAHLDTVFAVGTDTVPREDGAVIHGPGASDNGAGLAGLLALAAALRHAEIAPGATILFAANVGEEGEGDLRGMRHLFSAESRYFGRIGAAIALEGSGTATVVDRALGSRRLRVSVRGPGGHSWADAGVPNPIFALAGALASVAKIKLPAHPRTTLSVGMIAGGTSINSIPAAVTAHLDIRSTDAMQLDRTELAVLHALESGLGTRAAELRLDVERIGNRPSGALAAGSALAQSLRAVDRHLNLVTDARIGSTDANWPLSLGIPALAIAAGGVSGGIHTLQEWFDPTGRELALRRVLLLVLDACGG